MAVRTQGSITHSDDDLIIDSPCDLRTRISTDSGYELSTLSFLYLDGLRFDIDVRGTVLLRCIFDCLNVKQSAAKYTV